MVDHKVCKISDLLIDFNCMSDSQGLFYAKGLENCKFTLAFWG